MRRPRRWLFVAVTAAAAVACGLDVIGIAPAVSSDAGPDSGSPAPPPPDDVFAADVGVVDAGACVSDGGFCDPCDPTLVLCVRFDGGIVDESLYHRSVEVDGSPAFVLDNGVGAVSLDGSVFIHVPSGPGLLVDTDDTMEIVVRILGVPASGARAGFIDRQGGSAMFYFSDGHATCRELATRGGPAPPGFIRITCVTTLDGHAEVYADHFLVASGADARAANGFSAAEGFVIGQNSPSGDPFVGEIAALRIYTRAKSADEIEDSGLAF